MSSDTLEERITHLVRLWIDNDEGLYLHRRQLVRDALDEIQLEDALKEWVAELANPSPEGMVGDILTTALAFVDWHTMATDYMAEEDE